MILLLFFMTIFLVGCNSEKLDKESELEVEISQGYIGLSSGNDVVINQICVNKYEEIFIPMQLENSAQTLTNDVGFSFSKTSAKYLYLAKLNQGLRTDRYRVEAPIDPDDDNIRIYDCETYHDDWLIYGSITGEYDLSFQQEGDFLFSLDRNLNVSKRISPFSDSTSGVIQSVSLIKDKLFFLGTTNNLASKIQGPIYYENQDHSYFGYIDRNNKTHISHVLAQANGMRSSAVKIIEHNDEHYIVMVSNTSGNPMINHESFNIPTYAGSRDRKNIVIALDRDGKLKWTLPIARFDGAQGDYTVRHAEKVSDGIVYLVAAGTVQIGNTKINRYGNTDVYLFKVGFNGEVQWIEHFGSSAGEAANRRSFVIDREENIYLAISLAQALDVPTELSDINIQGSRNIAIVKLSSQTGNYISHKMIRTQATVHPPIVAIYGNKFYLTAVFKNYIKVGEQRVDFSGEEQLRVIKFEY